MGGGFDWSVGATLCGRPGNHAGLSLRDITMRLYLAGHLGWYVQKKSWVDVPLTQPTRLIEVLEALGVPISEVAVGTLNGATISALEEVRVRNEDVVELFPPVGGG